MRNIVCTLVGIIAVIGLIMTTPKAIFSPKGMLLPAKQVRAPIPASAVKIYHQAPQSDFQVLGKVHAELHFTVLNTQTQDALLAKVKSLAAQVGANGVVIELLVPNDGVTHVLTFIGTAI